MTRPRSPTADSDRGRGPRRTTAATYGRTYVRGLTCREIDHLHACLSTPSPRHPQPDTTRAPVAYHPRHDTRGADTIRAHRPGQPAGPVTPARTRMTTPDAEGPPPPGRLVEPQYPPGEGELLTIGDDLVGRALEIVRTAALVAIAIALIVIA